MTFTFKKAVRSASKLRLALSGTSGSGKTYGALLLAKGIGGKIAVIDTERGSASLYADMSGMPEFDVLDLDAPFTPERYTEAIRERQKFCVHGIIGARQSGASNEHEYQTQFS